MQDWDNKCEDKGSYVAIAAETSTMVLEQSEKKRMQQMVRVSSAQNLIS